MKSRIIGMLLSFVVASAFSQEAKPALVPIPQKMELRDGVFNLQAATRIITDAASKATGTYLAEQLRKSTGFPLPVDARNSSEPVEGAVVLTTVDAKATLAPEGYELAVTPKSIVIRAPNQAGLFYGVQSLLQLLPPQVFATATVGGVQWAAPCVEIQDQPRFKWRGLMLDVSRHFFSKAEVMRMLDLMAETKLNTFHWHLVDDPGWRIEIKKYPRLTEVGAWRKGVDFGLDPKSTTAYGPDGRYGGFYTQDDIREVVAYARTRHITIVPEIEMPGHSIGALSARPDLSCSGGPYNTDIGPGVHAGVYCAGNEDTFAFVQDVLTEVMDLFPDNYIHIGGDEVPKDNWKACPKCQARMKQEGLKTEHELQSYFIRRVEKFINAHGRNLMGWSEIREGGLAQNAAVMDWIGGGLEAASEGHDVVMTPTSECYFDYFQSQDTASEPRSIGGYLPLKKVYAFEPVPAKLAADKQSHILGGQGNVWTEYIASFKHVEYMAFPRLCALSEVTWSPKASRNWDDFTRRMQTHYQRMDQLGVNYYRDTAVQIGEWAPSQITTQGVTLEWDVTKNLAEAGKYRISLNYTEGAHGIRLAWVALYEDGRELVRDTHDGFTGSFPRKPAYWLQVPATKAGAKYTVKARVAGDGGTDSRGVVSLDYKPIK